MFSGPAVDIALKIKGNVTALGPEEVKLTAIKQKINGKPTA